MDSYEDKVEQLRKLYEEVPTDSDSDNEQIESENNESERDPFSDDGVFAGDSDYIPDESGSETGCDDECVVYENIAEENVNLEQCENKDD